MHRCRRAGLRPSAPAAGTGGPPAAGGAPRPPAAGIHAGIHASEAARIDHDRPIDELTAGTGAGAASRRARRLVGALAALVIVATACSGGSDDSGDGDDRDDPAEGGDGTTTSTAAPRPELEARDEALPTVVPTPQAMAWVGPDVPVAGEVEVTFHAEVDQPTRDALGPLLDGGPAEGPGLDVTLGALGDPEVAEVLDDAGVEAPAAIPAEGYVLAAVGYGPTRPAGSCSPPTTPPAGSTACRPSPSWSRPTPRSAACRSSTGRPCPSGGRSRASTAARGRRRNASPSWPSTAA